MNNGHIFMPYLQIVRMAAISKTENKIDISLSRKKLFRYEQMTKGGRCHVIREKPVFSLN